MLRTPKYTSLNEGKAAVYMNESLESSKHVMKN